MGAQPRVLKIPNLGEGATEGTVVAILVAAGSMVEAGQSLLEVETDKVTMEVPAEWSGRILEIAVTIGDTLTAGTRFATISASNDDTAPPTAETPEQSSTASSVAVDFTSSVSADAAAPERPTARVAAPLADDIAASAVTQVASPQCSYPAGPSARREARELGVSLSDVTGTGPSNRISRDDVRRHVRARLVQAPGNAPSPAPLPDLSAFGPVRSEPLPRIAQTTARNMARSASLIPHAWIQATADLTSLEAARGQIRRAQPPGEAPLTLSVLIVRAVAKQLLAHPRFNAAYDAENQALVMRQYINVGMAVASPRGLVVPVLRDPLAHDLKALAAHLDTLIAGACEQKLPLRAYQGAGFTISNLGGHGVASLQPLVNWPEVAILGVGALLETPSVVDGHIAVRRCISLTLGFDHRVINGADAAHFLGDVRAELENPLRVAT
ncbi:MAG: dihydrolipoamide acetyltransferase family protein [Gammaproteobacteria bacterium]